ncbi:MAG: topoisomerase [Herbaspirillum sp.]|jgi:DNA topoisomerase-1|nr:topoisomerase [Herbaspirillum sp.]
MDGKQHNVADRDNADPVEAVKRTAQQNGLRYVSDADTGYRRVGKSKEYFQYRDPDGRPVRDKEVLARIKALVIPPAWTEVWICRWPNGHIQVTGRDARRRKQYRYHPRWRSVRDEAKYDRMIGFGEHLPEIRRRVDQALALPGLPREKILAAIVYLLEATMMRVGNDEYARANRSFGLTTLRNRHVQIEGSEVEFHFRGKSGVQQTVKLRDPRMARIIRRTRDLPGQDLFQYVDENGERHAIGSADVNDYLRSLTGEDFTAKDFRTWAGTMLAAAALHACEASESAAQAKKNVVQAIEDVSRKLGNTPSICRKCYVHPAVIESYLDGTLTEALLENRQAAADAHALTPQETAVIAFLQKRLKCD